MAIVSVDLAYKDYRDIGVAVLAREDDQIACEFAPLSLFDTPEPVILAKALSLLCESRGASWLLMDGPQAWREESLEPRHSRGCERALNTPAKTGLPGVVKPANYGPFVAFSIAVYDALDALGWPRLPHCADLHELDGRFAVESFPLAAWRSLGITALPSKRRSRPDDLTSRQRLLAERYHIRFARPANHDELQATVAGLAGIALEQGDLSGFTAAGRPPFQSGGHWREGLIVNPR